jgi:rare lipoprotein A
MDAKAHGHIAHRPKSAPPPALARALAVTALALGLSTPLWAQDGPPEPADHAKPVDRESGQPLGRAQSERLSPEANPQLDRSGRRRVGKASFYAAKFAGRKMADGSPMEPAGNNAASRTLPLGTTAKVTNLSTGMTAIVEIRDRGPYVAGRIVDLSPATARAIGLDARTGVTRVAVSPITVPMPSGRIKLGDGVLEAANRSRTGARTNTGG